MEREQTDGSKRVVLLDPMAQPLDIILHYCTSTLFSTPKIFVEV
jgi:hypothetical protein